jgi:glutaredoxin
MAEALPGVIHQVHVAGFRTCPYHQRALRKARDTFGANRVDERTFPTRAEYKNWLRQNSVSGGIVDTIAALHPRAGRHTSSPFVWINEDYFVGGCDDLHALSDSLLATTKTSDNVLGSRKDFMTQFNNADDTMRARVKLAMRKYYQDSPGIQVGLDAPSFLVSSLDGATDYHLEDFYRQGIPLVLNFGSCS